ncbi:Membrane insertase OXA1/ALB3/YidC [Penicillium bovifimosum]|uniref:Membrane insertase OXA1/ALB3/YidC n=1 Tax=Penicillium bovifimosum TaxID=126998 RepID=A0A9W9HIT2_9EURO|nr:Membrane insertase OXA1/ALB3/YidC [Penicillium bovifimosum]KAJ5146192.1 Membrane insertase OXA1/ALB3/YidC [Penicillium bovifimosum]
MMGPIGLKGPGAAAALARQRMTAMSRSSRSISTLRSQSLRFPSQRGQLKSALSGSAPWRMTPVIAGPAGVRFKSTSSDPMGEVFTDSGVKDVTDVYDITTIPEHIGYLKQLGIDFGLGVSSTMQFFIEHMHVYTGLPWWASIVAVGLLTRLVMLKPILDASENSARMTHAKSKIDPLRQKMIETQAAGNVIEAQTARAEMQAVHAAHGISTWKSILPMIQIPLGFGCFRVVRAMTALPVPGLAAESAGWINDLTIADPTYLLPMIAAGTLCFSLRKGGDSGAMPMMQTEIGKYIIYGFPIISFVFMAFMPSALQLYFVATGIFGLGQTYLINSNNFRGWMKMTIPQKLADGHQFSELTRNTQSKGLRQLMERIEQEKAAQAEARKAIRVEEEAKGPAKVSIIDRFYDKFGKAGSDLQNSMSKTLGMSTPEQRLASDKKKRADEYEEQRKEEDELMRRKRNEARRREHLKAQELQRERAKKSLKQSQAAANRRG